jgi:hypothetical protein
MNLITAYNYLFYKFYKMFQYLNPTDRLTRSKAVMCVGLCEIWGYISIVNYWEYFSKQRIGLPMLFLLSFILFAIATFIHWFAFSRKDRWKNFFTEFEELSHRRNVIGTRIVLFFIILMVVNFIISFKLIGVSFF